MNVKAWYKMRPVSQRLFIIIALLLGVVVTLVEGLFEPLATLALGGVSGGFQAWHEAVLWGVSIVFPSLLGGYLLSRVLSRRISSLAQAARELSKGNFSARLPASNNDSDAFDVLSRSFNTMADSLEKLLRNERRLLADISHELRTPLTRMQIAVALMQKRDPEGAHTTLTQRLEKEVAHMSALVGQLLLQSRERIEDGGSSGMISLRELLEEVVGDYNFQIVETEKKISCNFSGALRVEGTPNVLYRVFSNIFSNAIFYAPEKSTIELHAEERGENAVVTVRDFGPGVPKDKLQDFFGVFFRVDDSRARLSGGMGLGLAMAREAVLSLGGSITAENALPGLCVTVALPLRADYKAAELCRKK